MEDSADCDHICCGNDSGCVFVHYHELALGLLPGQKFPGQALNAVLAVAFRLLKEEIDRGNMVNTSRSVGRINHLV